MSFSGSFSISFELKVSSLSECVKSIVPESNNFDGDIGGVNWNKDADLKRINNFYIKGKNFASLLINTQKFKIFRTFF